MITIEDIADHALRGDFSSEDTRFRWLCDYLRRGETAAQLQAKLDKAIAGLEWYAEAQKDEILLRFHENEDINGDLNIGQKAREILAEINNESKKDGQ